MKNKKVTFFSRRRFRRTGSFVLAAAMLVGSLYIAPSALAEAAETEYEIYPTPHVTTYGDGDYIIRNDVNVVYESGIDDATKDRLSETLALKSDISVSESGEIVDGKTNILVGIDGSGEYVDKYVDDNITVSTEGLFDELDSYVLDSDDGVITVLGADTDASFYGLTSLYHVIKQMDSYTIRNFHIEDWADVASRGFIEGYYGNPWSTEDRANLMTWGGYYKLNSYFYAPKNDPKHNSNWRELYTDEEIETLIKPLAEAGNASKCRYVYALHPFMYNAISFASEEAYNADLAIIEKKFGQVIEAGVRQIAILADDAANYNNTGNLGGNNYRRLLTDLTDWLKEMQKTYPDLKLTLPFCPVEYTGYGLEYYKDFPENVQVIMTGGGVWGQVTNNFTSTFTGNVGRGPYMWINWPCTDNSKKHLIMGGYSTFLRAGVSPDNLQGIMLNPMQQSEPSKVAIFGNACYTWNIWDSDEEADQAWNDSFKYVDHNSAIETESSNALKELSKHMINQAMDSRVEALDESVDLAPALAAFKDKLNSNSVTEEDVDALIEEFEILQDAADTYEAQAGDTNVRDQIIYWLDCWDDTTDAAIAYLNGVKAVINNDTTGILQYNTEGKTAFDSSKSHALWYVDHYEYAEVGVQHIVPFIQATADYVSKYAETAMNPDALIQSFITSRTDIPTGSTDNVFDGDDGTMASYRNPVWIKTGEYVGVLYNRAIEITDIRFLLGTGKNHFEASKLQYTVDGKEWQDLTLTGMENAFTGVRDQYLEIKVAQENLPEGFQAMGIRLIATADNTLDAYLNVHEIQIRQNGAEEPAETTGEFSTNRDRMNSTSWDALKDGNNGNSSDNEVWLSVSSGADKDKLPEGSYIQYTFGGAQKIESVHFAQGGSASGDVITDGSLQYLDNNGEWQTVGAVNNSTDQTFDLSDKNITTTAMRIITNKYENIWWRVGEFNVSTSDAVDTTPIEYNIIKTDRWTVYNGGGAESTLYDGDDNTYVWYDPDGSGNSTGDDFLVGDFLGYDLGKTAVLESAHIVVGHDGTDKLMNYCVETSLDNETWTPVEGYENYKGNSAGKDVLDIKLNGTRARYIRIRNLAVQGSWGKFSEFTVQEKLSISAGGENVYTNVNTSIGSVKDEGIVSLTQGTVTLNKDQYIGVKLDNIKAVTAVTTSELPENTVLETSMNGITWNNYEAGKEVDARYIRVRSTTDGTKLDLAKFDVNFRFVAEKSVESDFNNAQTSNDMRTAGTVNNVFDGNLSTIGMINGAQEAGKHITFDLGQVIHFSSIRYYIVETQLNYLRNADFEVSVDGEEWTKVLHVGQATENVWDDTTAKDMQDITLTHDDLNPGYMYAEAADLDVDGRYIRVTPAETYSHRWVGFSEIQINGGAYISPESNRDIVAEDVEEEGKIPSNMLDGDYSTTYKSSAKDSSFTYRLSEPEGVASVRMIQLGEVSGAEVTAKYIGEDKEESLGKLNQAINEFLIPEDKTLESITVTWKDVLPEIAEIATSSDRGGDVDKEALGEALKQTVNDAWTTDSKDAYQAAWDVANEIYNNKNVSQTVVDSALGSLMSAYNNAEMKATNVDELQALIDGKVSNENIIYSNVTYSAYESALNKLASALENADNLSQEEADTLKVNVENAQAALEYSTRNRELAELAVEVYAAFNADNYTTSSYQALTDAKDTIDGLVAQDKAAEKNGSDRVDPQTFIDVKAAFEAAVNGLVDVTELKEVLAKADTVDGTLYTEDSYQAYAAAVESGKALLENGTEDTIADAIALIIERYEALELKGDTALDDVIAEAEKVLEGAEGHYTTDSYNALKDIVAEAKEEGDDSYIDKIKDAMDALVSVDALRAKVNEANAVEKDTYTTSSYKVLSDLIAKTDELFESGSKDEISAMITAISDAIKGLEVRATGVEDYLESINLKDGAGYTEESYNAYKEAYDALMKADPSDLTADEFAALKANFEKAELALQKVQDDNGNTGDDNNNGNNNNGNNNNAGNTDKDKGDKNDGAVATGDNASVVPIVIVLVLCVAAVVAVIIIRKKKH